MKDYPVGIGSYDQARSAAIRKIKAAAGDDDLLHEVAEEVDPKKRQERDSNCQAARMVVDKCLENYKDGEYSFKTTMKMLCQALAKL